MVDFVIVGGGVYGCATALGLAQLGTSVRVLETGEVAGRASGGPGRRGVRANARDIRELPLMKVAYDVWPTLHQELGVEQFYERIGQLVLVETPEQLAAATAMCRAQVGLGIESRVVDRDELAELEPDLSETIIGGVYCPLDGVADHAATTKAYASSAIAAGATVSTGVAMKAIEVDDGGAVAVITSQDERIAVGRGVILLSNSEVAAQLRAASGLVLPVWNGNFQVLISEPLDDVPVRHLVGHANRPVSLKREGDDRLMMSGGWTGTWDDEARTGRPTDESVRGNVAETVALYPRLAGIEVAQVDVGHLEAVSADNIPLIDTAPGIDNLWFGTGWSGHGWAIAPVASSQIAEWCHSGVRPELLRPFTLDRFGNV